MSCLCVFIQITRIIGCTFHILIAILFIQCCPAGLKVSSDLYKEDEECMLDDNDDDDVNYDPSDPDLIENNTGANVESDITTISHGEDGIRTRGARYGSIDPNNANNQSET